MSASNTLGESKLDLSLVRGENYCLFISQETPKYNKCSEQKPVITSLGGELRPSSMTFTFYSGLAKAQILLCSSPSTTLKFYSNPAQTRSLILFCSSPSTISNFILFQPKHNSQILFWSSPNMISYFILVQPKHYPKFLFCSSLTRP